MKSLYILPGTKNKSNLQKLHVAERAIDNYSIFFNKYVLVKRGDSVFSVNIVFPQTNLNASFCSLDDSVLYCENLKDNLFPVFETSHLNRSVDHNTVFLLKKMKRTNKISLSLVFNDIFFLVKFKSELKKLEKILRTILPLYVFTNNSIIFPKSFESVGIFSILIHSTGNEPKRPCTPSNNCIIEFVKFFSASAYSQLIQNDLTENIGGLHAQFDFLNKIIKSHKKYRQKSISNLKIKLPNQILLVGPSGSGKTSLVRLLAARTGSMLLTVRGAEIMNKIPGETERCLRNVFQEARLLSEDNEHGVCILLIKQIECLGGKRNHETAAHILRCVSQLLNLLDSLNDSPGLIAIATTNKAFDLDPALRRSGRLETEVYVGVPSEKERAEILCGALSHLNLNNNESICRKVAMATPGYVGADLLMIVKMFLMQTIHHPNVLKNESDIIGILTKCASQHHPAVLKSGIGSVSTEPLLMSQLGGLDSIKQALKIFIEWPLLYPEKFSKFNVPPPKGILLYGPPGCAKTSLARAVATTTNTTFFSVSAAELYSPYVGTTERHIVELFHRARLSVPSIIFIDEIDALVGKRGDTDQGVHERVLSTFLTEMDGVGTHVDSLSLKSDSLDMNKVEVVVIAATNRPDKLDAAILRPGRLNKLIYVPPPSVQDRLSILKTITKKMTSSSESLAKNVFLSSISISLPTLGPSDIFTQISVPLDSNVRLDHLAKNTELFSGADLVNLVQEAGLIALTEEGMSISKISDLHFTKALKSIQPSLSEHQVESYSKFSFQNSSVI